MKTVDYGDFVLHHGNNLDVLRSLPANSVDSIVTDPPYGLGTEPDALAMLRDWITHDHHEVSSKRGFMGKEWDAFVPQPAQWRECLRVLKPGGHLLTFAGTRTQDLVALGLRIAGFEIRDMIAWVYGSGFPKSLDVSKAIDAAAGAEREVVGVGKGRTGGAAQPNGGSTFSDDAYQWPGEYAITAAATPEAQQWQGWGTALKPALEPITVARKPLIGTVAANVLAHGTGGLNIDGCRVATEPGGRPLREVAALREGVHYQGNSLAGRVDGSLASSKAVGSTDTGRWPANLVHDGSDEVVAAFPQAPGQLADASTNAEARKTQNTYGAMRRGRGDEPSASSSNEGAVGFKMKPGARRLDAGSAARFFYCAKASKADRDEGNNHPTVKPTDLMRYLCCLVTPPGGTILDPWMGSGSTGKAAVPAGFRFIGIDRDDWLDLAARRIATAHWGPWVFGGAA